MRAEPNRKKKGSFPWQGLSQKSHGLFAYCSPPNFLVLLIKVLSFPCYVEIAHGSPWLQTLNCNSLLAPNKPNFAGEISDSLFVFSQHLSVLSPGGIATAKDCLLLSHCFCVCYSLVGLRNAEPCCLSEIGDSVVCPSGSSLKSWGSRCVNKLFPGKCWQLGFFIGVS